MLAVQVSFHFAWHSSISAAPNILVFGNFADFRRLVGPVADSGGRLLAFGQVTDGSRNTKKRGESWPLTLIFYTQTTG